MILSVILVVLIICFGGVLLFGAPYLPTLKPQIEAALKMADLKPGDTLIELGSGDGRVMLAAAKQGINVVGYELNPILAAISWLRTLMYKKHTATIWGDFWQKDWPEHQAIFTFLLPKYMSKLDKKVMQSKHKPVKLVSFAFEIPGKQPAAQKDGVFLYVYR
jgi:hypothetical protein